MGVGGDYLTVGTIWFCSCSFSLLNGETADASVVQELTPAMGRWPFQVPPTPCPCLPVSCQSPAFPTIEVVEKMETNNCRSLTARQLLADTIPFLSLQPCFEPPPPPPPGISNPTASFTTGNKGSETLYQLLMVPELVGPLA